MLAVAFETELHEYLRKIPTEQQREVLDFAAALARKREAELEASYAEQAADEAAEADALEWADALIGDATDEAR